MGFVQRPDQYQSDTPPALGAGPRSGIIRARQVIIFGSGPNTGLFVYNGAPAGPVPGPANPPVFSVVAPGVTKDPYGNTLAAVLNIGTFSAAHTGFDQAGIEYLSDSSGTVRIVVDPARGMFFYTGAAGLGNSPQLSLALSGVTADTFGNAIGTSKILVQANVITESGGIFRTAAAAPLIQLDGSHNAYLQYNGAAVLTETLAPAATTDGLGNTVQGGITAYLSQTFFANLKSGLLTFADTVNAAFAGGQVSLTTVTSSDDAIEMLSPLALSTDIQASLILQRAATPGPAHAIIGNADLRLSDTSPPAPSGGTSYHSVAGMPAARSSADSNDYRLARRIFASSAAAPGQLINSITAVAVTGITAISVAAVGYHIRGMIIVNQGGVGPGNQAIQVTGPAITSMNIAFESVEAATIFNSGVATALNTNLPTGAIPLNTTGEFHFDGIIRFSASGATFGLKAICITSGTDNWTLGTDSYLELSPL